MSDRTAEPGGEDRGGTERPVVGVVVVTHGFACGDLVSAAEDIVGELPDVASVPVDAREPLDSIQRRVGEAVSLTDRGRGVLLLTDLHGSTPANACMALLRRRGIEVLFGVNLPMLIKLSTCDRERLDSHALAELLLETGRRSIRLGSRLTQG